MGGEYQHAAAACRVMCLDNTRINNPQPSCFRPNNSNLPIPVVEKNGHKQLLAYTV